MRWRKRLRNGDRNKGELGRGDQAMESLGTGARGERTEAREERTGGERGKIRGKEKRGILEGEKEHLY